MIVGFPGETVEEFDETKRFLETVRFYEMHIFKYSKREGTRAAVMENQVPEQDKSVRSDILLTLEHKMSDEYRESFLGKETEVLLEEKVVIGGQAYMMGHTRQYVKAVSYTHLNYIGSGLVLSNGQKIVRPVVLIVLTILFGKILLGG